MKSKPDISADEARHRSRIQLLVDSILPVLDGLDPELPPPVLLAQAVEKNVRTTVRTILESPEGRARQAEGRVRCVGAIYDIETGRVRFLEEPGAQGMMERSAGRAYHVLAAEAGGGCTGDDR